MKYFKDKFNSTFLIYIFSTISNLFAFSFLFLFLYQKGYFHYTLVWFYAFSTLVPVMFIPLLKKFTVKGGVLLGLLSYFCMVLTLLFFNGTFYMALLLFLFNSFAMIYYWIAINYLFFNKSNGKNNAIDSSLYMYIAPFLSVFLPPLVALIIYNYGYSKLFIFSMLLMFIPIFISLKYLKEEIVVENFNSSVIKFKNLKTITFFEGALQFFSAIIIPVYALFFINTESGYGWFLSYLALIGLVVGLILSYHSDKTKKRVGYIYGLFFLITLSMVSLAFANNIKLWYLLVGIFSIIATISSPLRLAITLDAKKIDLGFWKIREFYLNLGRVVTLSLAGLFFYFKLFWFVFMMYGLICLIYPFLVKIKLHKL